MVIVKLIKELTCPFSTLLSVVEAIDSTGLYDRVSLTEIFRDRIGACKKLTENGGHF